ncbi:colicin immunity domain-containing protein [Komagataeibacter xylinus]|uniref:colicin immunity domain-containing protein n=1 Tax=Komagataeibacter xylinus TaxID=28448 RepID=UPI00280AD134|nr:colicin immunity domain-containing protein [Komagataeibacter xylinus]
MADSPRERNIPQQMIALCHDRLKARVSPGEFADHYISLWKSVRDNGNFSLNHQDGTTRGAFDKIFTASVSYEPMKKDRDAYTIGATELDAVINRALPVIKKSVSGRSS